MKYEPKENSKQSFTAMNEQKQKETEGKGGQIGVKQELAQEQNRQEAKMTDKKNGGLRRRGNYFKGDDLPIL
jgi:hypothetical protein